MVNTLRFHTDSGEIPRETAENMGFNEESIEGVTLKFECPYCNHQNVDVFEIEKTNENAIQSCEECKNEIDIFNGIQVEEPYSPNDLLLVPDNIDDMNKIGKMSEKGDRVLDLIANISTVNPSLVILSVSLVSFFIYLFTFTINSPDDTFLITSILFFIALIVYKKILLLIVSKQFSKNGLDLNDYNRFFKNTDKYR